MNFKTICPVLLSLLFPYFPFPFDPAEYLESATSQFNFNKIDPPVAKHLVSMSYSKLILLHLPARSEDRPRKLEGLQGRPRNSNLRWLDYSGSWQNNFHIIFICQQLCVFTRSETAVSKMLFNGIISTANATDPMKKMLRGRHFMRLNTLNFILCFVPSVPA